MGELDKFSGKGVAPANTKTLTTTGKQTPTWVQPASHKNADRILQGSLSGRFAIALDATGSMAGLIDMAKRSIEEILRRVMREAGRPVEIMLVAYRDYDVPGDIVVTSAPSRDHNVLMSWLGKIDARGGGNNDGEAIERALQIIGEAGRFDAIMVAGDEPPNSRAFLQTVNRDAPLADDFARRFAQAGTPIHTFVVGDDPRTVTAFSKLASLSGGKSGTLDGSAEMIDMAVMAMLAALKGSEGVRAYMRDYHVTAGGAEFGRLLLEGPKK